MNVHQRANHNTRQACAACKYQRRKCQPDCTLAPYFPPNHQQQFLNAHRLFGVSNIVHSIKNLNSKEEKDEAMRTMIFEADARANDQVRGCYGIIRDLEQQYAFYKAELEYVNSQLALFRMQAQMQVNEKKMSLMGMEGGGGGSGGGVMVSYQESLSSWVGEDGVEEGGGGGSSSEMQNVEQNQQFLGLFDETLALESIECRGKDDEEGKEEESNTEILTLETKPMVMENVQGHDSKEVAALDATVN